MTAPLNYTDVMPAIQGEAFDDDREFYSYCGQLAREREHLMAMDGDWKLIIISPEPLDRPALAKSETLLFNLADDPGELNDVAESHPDVTARLTERALQFRALQPEEFVPFFWDGYDDFKAPTRYQLPYDNQ